MAASLNIMRKAWEAPPAYWPEFGMIPEEISGNRHYSIQSAYKSYFTDADQGRGDAIVAVLLVIIAIVVTFQSEHIICCAVNVDKDAAFQDLFFRINGRNDNIS